MKLLALKEIQPGDELMFFYPSSEWAMTQAFDCFCGTAKCLHRIQGASYLTEEEACAIQTHRFYTATTLKQKEEINTCLSLPNGSLRYRATG
jgi:hypothetical protein